MITAQDERSRRCPLLGHDVPFSYCRLPGQDIPCRKILQCWHVTFDIAAFLNAHYDEAVREKISAPPPPKIASLFDLIQQAKERQSPG